MSDKEKVAEDAIRSAILNNPNALTERNLKKVLLDSYHLGYEAAEKKFKPVKINEFDESTWRPLSQKVLCRHTFTEEWEICSRESSTRESYYTYWMPLPEIGE